MLKRQCHLCCITCKLNRIFMKVDDDYELQNNLGTERSNTDVYDTEITVLALFFFVAQCSLRDC